ncbi:GNAT family N-acetyltransferase [Microbaculum sp. FT89]|uniref:GNAT family N-acetyltransferase n=1 Tax=Microbaculum sp. FT89 TaxID=3447298 RepID=UPI003F530F0F
MLDEPHIRRARVDEAGLLTDLVLRAKAHWGYDEAFIEACRDELTVQSRRIETGELWVVEIGGRPAGVLEVLLEDRHAEVFLCFVDPSAMGRGVGRVLWTKAEEIARAAGLDVIGVDSDPHAEGFYRTMGAVRVGEAPSGSISGRMLPRLVKQLD